MTLDDIGEDIEADQDKHSHCDECNQYFVLKEHLDTHENKAHCMAKERPVKGDDDGLEEDGKQVFWLKKAYQSVLPLLHETYWKSVHKDIHYSSDKCDKSFTDQGNLQRHVKSEHQKIQYSCDKCDKSFTGQGNLQRQVRS